MTNNEDNIIIELLNKISELETKLAKSIEIHRRNAGQDYRGNRESASVRSYKLLEELELL